MQVDALLSRTKPVPVDCLGEKLADLPFAPALPSPTSRYGLACVAAERARRAKVGSSYLQPVWDNLLSALRLPGPWEHSEPMFAAIRNGDDAPKLRSILELRQCGLPLARIGPIGARGARALHKAHVATPDALMRIAADPASRAALATATGLDVETVESWAHLAELAVVLEIAYEGAGRPPHDVGDLVTLARLATIPDAKTMASVDPSIVAAAIERANRAEHRLIGFQVSDIQEIVVRWRDAAARWLSHIGREGASSMVQPAPPAPTSPPSPPVPAPTNGASNAAGRVEAADAAGDAGAPAKEA